MSRSYESKAAPRIARSRSPASAGLVDKGSHRHFMAKEIYEQPEVVGHTLAHYHRCRRARDCACRAKARARRSQTRTRLTISACGTAYYAGLVGKYWFEKLARMPVEVDVASEFRYRDPVYPKGGLALFISQSGETADTLAALRYARRKARPPSPSSTCRKARSRAKPISCCRPIAGPEIGVASTKAFTCQLAVLAALAIAAGARARPHRRGAMRSSLCAALLETPRHMVEFLKQEAKIEALAQEIAKARDVLYLGRGRAFPARARRRAEAEGNFLHPRRRLCRRRDEARPHRADRRERAGDRHRAARALFEKTISNMQEVMARGGKVRADLRRARQLRRARRSGLDRSARSRSLIAPLLYAVPVQLLAYHMALSKGTDVDQPRNLAKSVTVE